MYVLFKYKCPPENEFIFIRLIFKEQQVRTAMPAVLWGSTIGQLRYELMANINMLACSYKRWNTLMVKRYIVHNSNFLSFAF